VVERRRLPLTAVYDGQCEICQAAVSWIRLLDRRGAVRCVAITDGPLADVHPALALDECLAQLHVVDSDGRIDVGWQAVARIAEAIPLARPLATLDRNPVTRAVADRVYGYVARNRHQFSTCRGGSCVGAGPAGVRGRADASPFWTCYSLGMLLRLPLVAGVAVADQVRFARDYTRTFRRREIERKVEFLAWLDTRIAEATADGRPDNSAVAACFPWGRRWSWERLAADEIARATTIGEFSRHQLIRSVHRAPEDVLPVVFEARFAGR
jgi:predicted DCC family thiol-disulfide oxidoreductase YuxK